MTPADVKALKQLWFVAVQCALKDDEEREAHEVFAELLMADVKALIEKWRADARAEHEKLYQDEPYVRANFPRLTTVAIRRWLKCADELESALLQAPAREGWRLHVDTIDANLAEVERGLENGMFGPPVPLGERGAHAQRWVNAAMALTTIHHARQIIAGLLGQAPAREGDPQT